MGASAPTEPPNPIVREEVSTEDHTLCGFMRELLVDTASNTLVTPCEILSLTTKRTSRPESSIPTPGSSMRQSELPSTKGETPACTR